MFLNSIAFCYSLNYTGCFIDIYLGRERIKPYFNALVSNESTFYLSVITEAELWRGLRVGELDKHNALVAKFTVLPLRSDGARLAGAWMQQYREAGLGWMDALITATAKTAEVPVLTRDKKLATVLANEARFEIYN